MEFYLTIGAGFAAHPRFNSQRDGILRNFSKNAPNFGEFQFPTGWNSTLCMRREAKNERVSIPNGMEFYPVARCSNTSKRMSFNSQRDGILLSLSVNFKLRKLVSIPNGMEFYNVFRSECSKISHVSIPNGMEFYKMRF